MLPSAPNVSVAVTQVVIPGSAELTAVSKVQSIKAPFGSVKRCVGSTRARTAGVAVGFRSDESVSPPGALLPVTSELVPGAEPGGASDVIAASPSVAGAEGSE